MLKKSEKIEKSSIFRKKFKKSVTFFSTYFSQIFHIGHLDYGQLTFGHVAYVLVRNGIRL